MKLKSIAVSALAALAISGLLAAPASAEEEESRLTLCAMVSPVDEAYLAEHNNSREELHAAWLEIEPRYCASVRIPAAEMDEVSRRIGQCWEARLNNEGTSGDTALEKAAAEECIEAWGPNGAQVARAPRHLKKKRVKKRHATAKVALAAADKR